MTAKKRKEKHTRTRKKRNTSIPKLNITNEGVEKVLKNINTSKATGRDEFLTQF